LVDAERTWEYAWKPWTNFTSNTHVISIKLYWVYITYCPPVKRRFIHFFVYPKPFWAVTNFFIIIVLFWLHILCSPIMTYRLLFPGVFHRINIQGTEVVKGFFFFSFFPPGIRFGFRVISS